MPRPGPRTTYRYSDEFKATAVKLEHLKVEHDLLKKAIGFTSARRRRSSPSSSTAKKSTRSG